MSTKARLLGEAEWEIKQELFTPDVGGDVELTIEQESGNRSQSMPLPQSELSTAATVVDFAALQPPIVGPLSKSEPQEVVASSSSSSKTVQVRTEHITPPPPPLQIAVSWADTAIDGQATQLMPVDPSSDEEIAGTWRRRSEARSPNRDGGTGTPETDIPPLPDKASEYLNIK